MDEELMSRRKRTKDSGQRSKAEREVLAGSSDNISGRPELVGVSKPNVKIQDEGDEDEPTDALLGKEQILFSLVSEGSEILNIVVPPKLPTVDEEESKEMMDNLSYLEENPVPPASGATQDEVFDVDNKLELLTNAPSGSNALDPPGAPVARPPDRATAVNVDYFEAFNLTDAGAPGSPAGIAHGLEEPEAEEAPENQETDNQLQSEDVTTTTTVCNVETDAISLEEITSELLDDVFYGGTDLMKSPPDRDDSCRVAKVSRLLSKQSGSTLFGSEEDILTPIFLPDGPPKIIDPVLLEEPKAMAFLYTDLYEEAIGGRKKEEDTESMTSEKSFHSRHSDREARGYLEKYVLIDETPVVKAEPTDKEKSPEEGPRTLSQKLYDFTEFPSKPEKGETPNSEEEITDFFRSSANSSPCEPFPRSTDEDETQPTKSKSKTKKNIPVTEVAKLPADPLDLSNISPEEPDWGSSDLHPTEMDEKDVPEHIDQEMWKRDLEIVKPVAPPRKRATSSPKASLDLTPLTPVDVPQQENQKAGVKELKVEEKETASPVETADEGDGDGEEATQIPPDVCLLKNASTEPPKADEVEDSNKVTVRDATAAAAEEKNTGIVEIEERSDTEAAANQTEPDTTSSESFEAEKQGDSSTPLPSEPAKDRGQCVIL